MEVESPRSADCQTAAGYHPAQQRRHGFAHNISDSNRFVDEQRGRPFLRCAAHETFFIVQHLYLWPWWRAFYRRYRDWDAKGDCTPGPGIVDAPRILTFDKTCD